METLVAASPQKTRPDPDKSLNRLHWVLDKLVKSSVFETEHLLGSKPRDPANGDSSQKVETLACEASVVGALPTGHPNRPQPNRL
jgi:hypothetical protein